MAYCVNCGKEIVPNAKFCQKCGYPTGAQHESSTRQQEFAGKIYKCPNCGEVLKAFEINCPSCGHELRGTRASNAVKEFALKLEAIESRRDYERPRGLFAAVGAQQRISKTDEQKISLIKSFAVPNSKEDMLEFMILATSSINMRAFDSANTNISKSEQEINDAWFSKVRQVYEKAKRSYSTDTTFIEIKTLYDSCNREIKKSKKKGVVKWTLMVGWMPLLFAAIFLWIRICAPIDEKKEVARLDAIVEEVEIQLYGGQYKYALMNADGLVYSGSIKNDEQSRQWEIKREYWIDRIIEEAAENGVILERPKEDKAEDALKDKSNTSGFVDGVNDGFQPRLDAAKENIDEFNRIINGDDSAISKEMLDEFIEGYEKGEFDKFNSLASENGLAESRIYFYCAIEKTEILEADGTTTILGYAIDEGGNRWLTMLHVVPVVSETHFDSYVGKDIIIRGVYSGFSRTKEMPVLVLDEFIVIDTAEVVWGMQKLLDE